jgi:hypothetical protein
LLFLETSDNIIFILINFTGVFMNTKFQIFPVLCVFLTGFFFSCSAAGEKTAAAIKLEAGEKESVVIRTAAMYLSPEASEWIKNIDAGTVIASKNIIQKNSKDMEYAQVRTDKTVGWVYAYNIVQDAKPGLITNNETAVYTEPRAGSISSNTRFLDKMQLAAVHREAADDSRFVKISYFDEKNKTKYVKSVFIKAEAVSTEDIDLRCSEIYKKITAAADPLVKKALIEDASAYSKSVFYSYIQAEAEKLAEAKFETDSLFTVSSGVINDDNVNVRSNPGTHFAVVSQLSSGTAVKALQKTKNTETLSGKTDSWYFIKADSTGSEGWVFGSFLSFTE